LSCAGVNFGASAGAAAGAVVGAGVEAGWFPAGSARAATGATALSVAILIAQLSRCGGFAVALGFKDSRRGF
jgi:hypothetical protein